MNALTVFAFDSHAVRCLDRDGAPWFVATDVASVLGYRNAPDMVRMLDDDERGTHIVRTLGGDQEVGVISESGLYACILKSRRPEAVPFRKWVTAEVLPSIRKTGAYRRDSEPAREIAVSPQHQADVLVSADRTFRSVMRSARAAGLTTGMAIRRAQAVALERTGIDILQQLAMPLPPEDAPGLAPAPAAPRWRPTLEAWTTDHAGPAALLDIAREVAGREDMATQLRIAAALRELGWVCRKLRMGLRQGHRWIKPEPEASL